jgi:hypothetical protein
MENAVNQTPEQITFRAKLWKEFVSRYQLVLAIAPDTFSTFCAKFRERWIAGK